VLEVYLKLLAPPPSNHDLWPLILKTDHSGVLLAHFNQGDTQTLLLNARLLRAMLLLQTDKPQKNDYAIDEIDFGRAHTASQRIFKFYLSNLSEVTAKWRLNYVAFPKKPTIGYMTKTPWEGENLEKTDDPQVFEFSVTEVMPICLSKDIGSS
jgi:hypothetical protein